MKPNLLPPPVHPHRWLLIWLWFLLRDPSPPSGFR
jgi:hypothetical protein